MVFQSIFSSPLSQGQASYEEEEEEADAGACCTGTHFSKADSSSSMSAATRSTMVLLAAAERGVVVLGGEEEEVEVGEALAPLQLDPPSSLSLLPPRCSLWPEEEDEGWGGGGEVDELGPGCWLSGSSSLIVVFSLLSLVESGLLGPPPMACLASERPASCDVPALGVGSSDWLLPLSGTERSSPLAFLLAGSPAKHRTLIPSYHAPCNF